MDTIAVGDLSEHFSAHEFVDRRTGHYVAPPQRLLTVIEGIRQLTGAPLIIISAHRCRASNAVVGGAKHSRHIVGDAVDFRPGHATVAQAHAAGASGVGSWRGWAVHVDVRPGGPVDWTY